MLPRMSQMEFVFVRACTYTNTHEHMTNGNHEDELDIRVMLLSRHERSIMNIDEFRTVVKEYLLENYEEYEVTEHDATKNNNLILHGLCIKKKNEKIAPTIYLENYLKDYNIGISMEVIARNIVDTAENAQLKGEIDVDFFMSYEKIKDHIYIKLVNKEANTEMLKELPHKEFLDLAMIVYCDVSKMCGICASVTVKNDFIRRWEVSEEEIISQAYSNTKNAGATIWDMRTLIKGRFNEDKLSEAQLIDAGSIFVMGNEAMTFGAIAMTFDDVLDEFINNSCKGVYIIPSSIHEVILIRDKEDGECSVLNDMVKQVNSECLEKEDILADHAYYYSPDNGYSIVEDK